MYSGPTRMVDSSILDNAPRFHVGGIVGASREAPIGQDIYFHTGGVAGLANDNLAAANDNRWTADSPRMHGGGLAHDEYPAILQRGERVLSVQQNHRFESIIRSLHDGGLVGAGGGTTVSVPSSMLIDAPRFHEGTGGSEFSDLLSDAARGIREQKAQEPATQSTDKAAPMTFNFNFPSTTTPDSFKRAGQQVANNVSAAIDRVKSRNGGR